MTSVEKEVAPKAGKALPSHTTTCRAASSSSSLWTSRPNGGFIESPPHSIRTRLWSLHSETYWKEVLTVSQAVAAKHQEIEDCQRSLQQVAATRLREHCEQRKRLVSLQNELDDWTWPVRLAADPRRAWDCLKDQGVDGLLRHPSHCREAAWILLHSQRPAASKILRHLITANPTESCCSTLLSWKRA